MNISHEDYLKQFQQSRLLAEAKTNLYGPFNTVPMGMPGGNPNVDNTPTYSEYNFTQRYNISTQACPDTDYSKIGYTDFGNLIEVGTLIYEDPELLIPFPDGWYKYEGDESPWQVENSTGELTGSVGCA